MNDKVSVTTKAVALMVGVSDDVVESNIPLLRLFDNCKKNPNKRDLLELKHILTDYVYAVEIRLEEIDSKKTIN